ncbi:Hypothetical protein, putative [Bodo saltans]|uniref:Uncharacterized protein n=1 Tax=Bodo saltans TaxID=75058 RepID=A0A0S4J1Q6_BODSA|nr:Hypothetical protein, putative [Bodo saltans]|eukprot:CUG60335.1 Hypothetical protein, putative [Bodo saltans]
MNVETASIFISRSSSSCANRHDQGFVSPSFRSRRATCATAPTFLPNHRKMFFCRCGL